MELEGKRVAADEFYSPCPFKHIGTDRFHYWTAADLWWCRNPDNCPDCPGRDSRKDIGTKWGNISYKHHELGNLVIPEGIDRTVRVKSSPPSIEMALRYHGNLNERTVQFLRDRGIYYETALRFLIGRDRNWLTIPSIVNGKCIAIKKRWIGKPPPGVLTYIFEKGSRGRSLFNWDRFRSRKHWHHFLMTKAPLDILLLDQLGIPAIGPLGGEGVWNDEWTPHLDCVECLVNVGDNDSEGRVYAERRQKRLNGNSRLAYLPIGKDPTEAYLSGVDLHDWVQSIIRG